MRKSVIAVAALLALAFTGPAFAIVQDTNTTVTSTAGSEIKTAEIKIEQPGRPPQTIRVTGKSSTKARLKIDTDKPVTVTVVVDGKPDPKRGGTVDGGAFLRGGVDLGPGLAIANQPVAVRIPATAPATPAQAVIPSPAIIERSPSGGSPSGFYVGVFGGWGSADSTFTPNVYSSLNQAEETRHISRGASDDSFTLGGSFGYGFAGTPFALEAQLTWLNNKATIQGLPGNQFPVTENDTLTIKKDWMATLSGLYYLPGLTENSNLFVKGGVALVREKVSHHCPSNGWCGVVPTTPFTSSNSTWSQGWVLGGGYQFQVPSMFGAPTYLRLYYEHVFVREFDVRTGDPAIRAINGGMDQDIDRFAIGLVVGSDVRLKTDIVPLGKRSDGIALYRYRYLWSGKEYVGVMAQEVAAIRPDAVLQGTDGFLRVDYGKLGTRLMTFDEWSWQKAAQVVQ